MDLVVGYFDCGLLSNPKHSPLHSIHISFFLIHDGFAVAVTFKLNMLEDPCHLSTSSGIKAVATSADPLQGPDVKWLFCRMMDDVIGMIC